ncbi:hypothetical protein [Paenibacillus glucanolyticus]|uniref:hypothetical protein n=1 Tax=Paenibacillus glucanolyticus TaxID=59843 RepID=UPI00128B2BD5|nr:hypothetical protein [Paenibacillus glucanolyticus]MPY15642.1 hypothetical protein [Paenibacillus glucanolyticus]
MKKIASTLCILTATIFLMVPAVNAEESTTDDSDRTLKVLNINSNLSIEKKADGRVYPVISSKDSALTSVEQEVILKEMGYTLDEIETMNPSVKQDMAISGGRKVEVETNIVQYFNSSDGKRYLVTDENREEIEALRQQEAERLSKELNKKIEVAPLSNMGSTRDGIFSGRGHVSYQGKSPNATEFQFRYTDTFDWSGYPKITYTDTFAHAWQSHSTSVSSEGRLTSVINGSNYYNNLTINPESIYGSSTKISLSNKLFETMSGYIANEVRIPISYKGTTGKFIARYAHPWTVVQPSIAIGPASISYSGYVGDEWFWENTFTITSVPSDM